MTEITWTKVCTELINSIDKFVLSLNGWPHKMDRKTSIRYINRFKNR